MKQLEVYFNEIKAGILTEKRPGIGYSIVLPVFRQGVKLQ